MSNIQLLTPPPSPSPPVLQPASNQTAAPAPTPRRHRQANRTTETGDNQVEVQQQHHSQQQSKYFTEIEIDYEPQRATQNVWTRAKQSGKLVSPMRRLWEAKTKKVAEAKKKKRRSDKYAEMSTRMLVGLNLEQKQQDEEEGGTKRLDSEMRD